MKTGDETVDATDWDPAKLRNAIIFRIRLVLPRFDLSGVTNDADRLPPT